MPPDVRDKADDRKARLLNALHLDPVLGAVGPIRRISLLRDDALQVHTLRTFKQLLRIHVEVLAVEHRRMQSPADAFQDLFAFDQRRAPEVSPIEKEDIEQVKRHAVLAATGEVSLQQREVGAVVFDHDNLAVQDGADVQIERIDDRLESVRPVVTAARVDFGFPSQKVCLGAIAIELDFVEVVALGRFGFQCSELRLDEARHWRFDAENTLTQYTVSLRDLCRHIHLEVLVRRDEIQWVSSFLRSVTVKWVRRPYGHVHQDQHKNGRADDLVSVERHAPLHMGFAYVLEGAKSLIEIKNGPKPPASIPAI